MAAALGALALWPGLAQTVQAGDFGYTNINGAITLTQYSGAGGSVAIPDQIDGLPVVSIGTNAFYKNTAITNLVLPNSITNIGDRAFYGCAGLVSLAIPDSVAALGSELCINCVGLKTVALGNGLRLIPESAFENCTALTQVSFSRGVTNIEFMAFRDCVQLQQLDLPETVTTIGIDAFGNCDSLSDLTLPNSVISLDLYAFGYCTHLTRLVLSTNLVKLGAYCFNNCTRLSGITIPASTTQIDSGVLFGCAALTNISVAPENPAYLSQDGVVFNKSLSSLVAYPSGKAGSYTVPETVSSIEAYAFNSTVQITEIHLGAGVTNLGSYAFSDSQALTNISVAPNNPNFCSRDGVLFTNDQTILIQYPAGRQGSYTIPETVTNIGEGAFASSSGLSGVSFPTNLIAISIGAFDSCSGLTSLLLPASLKSIGIYAFAYCDQLISLYFLGNAPSIVVPSSYGGSYYSSYVFHGSTNLSAIYRLSSATGWFSRYGDVPVKIWSQSAPYAYQVINGSALEITDYVGLGGTVTIPDQIGGLPVVSIGDNAFYYNTAITNIVLPNSITNIGFAVFYGCARLTSLALPDSVTRLGDSSFGSCLGLTNLVGGKNLVSIGKYAFNSCYGLTELALPDSLTNLDSFAFYHCTNLARLTLPAHLASLGDYVFMECARLLNVQLPASLTALGKNPFAGCDLIDSLSVDAANPEFAAQDGLLLSKDLATLVLYPAGRTGPFQVPGYVTRIGDFACDSCAWLTGVEIPANVALIGKAGFANCRSLTNFTVAADNAQYLVQDGVLFDASRGNLLAFPAARTGSYTLPQTVTNVAHSAFSVGYGLTQIVCSPQLISLEANAFANCVSLTNVTLSDTLTTIGENAFLYCIALKSLTLPATLAYIGDGAFAQDSALTSLHFQGNVPPALGGADVFSGATALQYVYCPRNATGWRASFGGKTVKPWDAPPIFLYQVADDNTAFITNCVSDSKTIAVPETVGGLVVAGLGPRAFAGCTNLTSLTLPDSLTTLGNAALAGCAKLRAATLGNQVTSVGDYAFYQCSALTAVALPVTLTNLGDYAFAGCAALKAIDLPGGVIQLGIGAFAGCAALQTFTLPDGLTRLGEDAFQGCVKLTAFATNAANPNFSVNEGVIFDPAQAILLQYPPGRTGAYAVPKGVTDIGAAAFSGAAYLGTLTMPDSVTRIGDFALANCPKLAAVLLAEGLVSLGDWAFTDCDSLVSLTLPSTLAQIGDYAFSACAQLKTLSFNGNAPTLAGDNVFYNSTQVTSYYLRDATGWGATYGGFPTEKREVYTYVKLSETAIAITQYLEDSMLLIVPPTIDGMTVVSIGDSAFARKSSLTGVTLPDTVTNLGASAFISCGNLKSVALGNAIRQIGDNAFANCYSLTNLDLGQPLTVIGAGAFYACQGLSALTLPDSVTTLGANAFKSCGGLKSIQLGARLTTIEHGTFNQCGALTNLDIPDSVVGLNGSPFDGCAALSKLTIGAGVTNLSFQALVNAPALTDLRINPLNPVYSAQDSVWFDKDKTTLLFCPRAKAGSYTVPHTVTNLETAAFQGCSSLTNIDLPDGLFRIGDYAFANCAGLTALTLPDRVNAIGAMAFSYCYNLRILYFEGNQPESLGYSIFYKTRSMSLYRRVAALGWGDSFLDYPVYLWTESPRYQTQPVGVATVRICRYNGAESDLVVPEQIEGLTVIQIATNAFSDRVALTNIALPNTLTTIGDGAFARCVGLTAITLPDSVTALYGTPFLGCTQLTKLVLGGGLTHITAAMLGGCPALSNYDVSPLNPAYTAQAGVLFSHDLATLVAFPPNRSGAYTVPNDTLEIGPDAFLNCAGLTDVELPANLARINTNAFSGCASVASLTLPASTKIIAPGAFYGCVNLRSARLAAHLEFMGDSAFAKCSSLTELELGQTLTNLEPYAFSGCSRLANLQLPDRLTRVGPYAFQACSSLTNIHFSPNLTLIDQGAFAGCSSLEALVLPERVIRIADQAFSGCELLKSLVLPANLSAIEGRTFSGCTALARVQFPEHLTTVGYRAFENCVALTAVFLPASLVSIESEAFAGCSRLTALYFEGNAPVLTGHGYLGFNAGNGAVLYYVSGASGWGTTWANQPTATWVPLEYDYLDSSRVVITRYRGSLDSLSVPETLAGLTVASIGGQAFADCATLTNLVLPAGVTRLENEAFLNCSNLTRLRLPDNLDFIGDAVFAGCSGLPSLALPDSVTHIGAGAFSNCAQLAGLALGSRLDSLGDYPCLGCDQLWNFSVASGNPRFSVSAGALIDTRRGQVIQYAPGKTGGCQLPDGVVSIGERAFGGSLGLVGVEFPASLTNIGAQAFESCPQLTSLQLPASVAWIDRHAFANCSGLTNLSVAAANPYFASVDGVLYDHDLTTLLQYPYGRPGSFEIPAATTRLDANALAGCPRLTNLTVAPLNPVFSAAEGVLFNRDKTVLLQYPAGRLGNYALPDSVGALGEQAFYGASHLAELSAPGNAPELRGEAVFTGATRAAVYYRRGASGWGATYGGIPALVRLDSLAVDYQVLSPTTVCLYHYTGGGSLYAVPDLIDGRTVVALGHRTFASCPALETVAIPASVTALGADAFVGGAALQSLAVDPSNPAYLAREGVLFDKTGAKLIAYPPGRTNGHYSLPQAVTAIEEYAFTGNPYLTTLAATNYVQTIGAHAFADCAGLARAYFSTNAPALAGTAAFARATQAVLYYRAGASGWTDRFGGCQTALWKPSDFGCAELKGIDVAIDRYLGPGGDVVAPSTIDWLNVVAIADSAFAKKTSVVSVTLSDGIASVGKSAFSDCPNLTRFAIGKGLTNLGELAFFNCTNILDYTVDPANAVFSGVDGLLLNRARTRLLNFPAGRVGAGAIPAGVTAIGNYAFSRTRRLTSLAIPEGVATVGTNAFANCVGLTTLILPTSLAVLQEYAFAYCPSLTGLYFQGDAPVLLGKYVFYNSPNVTLYYLPATAGWSATFGGRPALPWAQTFAEWAASAGLTERFPNACGEQDDADRDGLTNLQEKNAGTDPTRAQSALAFEAAPRGDELSAEDQTPIAADQFALYFQAVPGKTYEVMSCDRLSGEWTLAATLTATAPQKRAVLRRPAGSAFYRVRVR